MLLASAAAAGEAVPFGARLALPWALPFAGLLLTIAMAPLTIPRVWHHHYGKIAAGWSLLLVVPFVALFRSEAIEHLLQTLLGEYVSFLAILFGLFTVSGGIVVRGTLRGTPAGNTLMLLTGTLLASLIGTTGASMLLIRPLLRANQHRRSRTHIVVFFIFLVSNIGGSLTPLGDPPLFLGFLQGVPFFWTLRLWLPTGLAVTVLLIVFHLLDRRAAAQSDPPPADVGAAAISLGGRRNLVLLGAIVLAVLLSGLLDVGSFHWLGIEFKWTNLLRDLAIVLIGAISLVTTSRQIRLENRFDWGPMREVAKLFAAIFITIVPAIAILEAGERGALAGLVRSIREPWQFFWATGLLSSFLDNAPTYLSFFFVAIGRFAPGLSASDAVHALTTEHALHLEAISAGAVFMGANSYIGNAPNFMVKSIAEEQGVEMPSFFGYIVRWVFPILLPVLILDTLLFRCL